MRTKQNIKLIDMKRLLTLAAMFLCCMATSFAQFSGSGSGTENDPYLILNPIQLNQMRNFSGQHNVFFKLMADIDLSDFINDEYGSQGWLPISSFYGLLDGNGKTIAGLRINRPNLDYVGLFNYSYGFRIQNLTIKDADIRGNEYVGLIVGHLCGGIISNCVLSGKIEGKTYVGGCIGGSNEDDRKTPQITNINSSLDIIGGEYTGGIIGRHFSSDFGVNIQFCNLEKSKITGSNYVGGIFGKGTGTIQNSIVCSDIIGDNFIGGISGYGGNVKNCGFWGVIQASSNVGGIAGISSTISNCCVIGKIKCEGNSAGGIIGASGGNIKNNYFNGSIIGLENIGGIVGAVGSHSIVSNCISNATISGTQKVGGIAGTVTGYEYSSVITKLNSNIAILNSINASIKDVGRIYGCTSGYVIYGSMGTSGENKALNRAIVIEAGVAKDVTDGEKNGTGASPTTLKLKATYVAMGYDLNDIWEIQETECYPYFKSQTAPPVITSQVVSGATTISGNCVSGGTITLEIDGVKQQTFSNGNTFSFTVSPLQVGQEIWVSAKAEGKEPSYYAMATVSFMGKGTESDPYQVYTAGDLKEVYRKGYFKLMNDIDLTSYINTYGTGEGWEAIGRDGSETVYFDGNGHKITGLWCNTTRDNTGLFSCFANGYIKNLTVETASGKQVKGGKYTGIIIGKLINGEITNCKAFGTVADGTPVGGMIGKLDGGKLLRCQTNVTINVTGGNSYVGGLAGEITGDVEECLSNGTLTATGTNSYAGGLVGLVNSGSNITNCYSNAKVSSSYNAAGLVAYNYGVVDKCYATGDLFSKNYGAGVIGYNDGAGAVVKNCVAMNNKIDVTYESQSGQGGGYGQRIIGGIKNGAPAPEMNNYALKTMQVSLNNVPQKVYDDIMNGVAKVGADLIKASTYQSLGWDFTNIWNIVEGESYPSLKNNIANVITPVLVVPEITADDKTREYGEANPELTYKVSADITGKPQLTTTATKTSPAGVYDIVVERGTVVGNYTSKNGKLTVTKAPLSISGGTYTIKQGEALPTFVASYSGFKNGETESVLTKKPTLTTTATSSSAPGEYEVIVSGAEAQNYNISYTKGKLTITKADPVTVTAKSYTRVYGEANPTFEYTTSGAALTGTPQISCAATATSPVGTYDIIVSQGSVTNYNVTYVKGTLTITKAPLTIKAGTYTKKQGEDNPTFTLTYEGFKNNETEAVLTKKPTVTCDATKGSQPGDYAVKVSGAEATNYDISYVNGVLKVTEADAVIVTAKSYTRVYGDVNPIFEYTTSGAALSGTPQISCAATATSPVGTYDIIVSQGSVTNYNVTYVKGTLTITKAPLTISAGNYSKIEGEENPTFEATYSGFKNNETEKVLTKRPTITTTATKTSSVGEYPVIVSGAEARNYDISYIDGVLTIMKDPNKFDENGASYEKQGGNSVIITGDEGATGEYDIPESVTHDGVTFSVTGIGEEAYKDNIFISQVTIPSSVTFIGNGAFAGCTNLMTIIIYVLDPIDISKARTRSGASSVFEGVDKNYCILYVPDVSVSKYRAAEGWKEFRDIRGISTLGINEVVFEGKAMDVYDLNGRKVLRQATSLHELPKGVYIINGRKVVR